MIPSLPPFLRALFLLGMPLLLIILLINAHENEKLSPFRYKNKDRCMSKNEIVIYTTEICPYCVRAKKLLNSKGVKYKEIDVSHDPDLRTSLVKKTGGRTSVPQIFIGDTHVGGSDDLYALDQAGKLDILLGKC